MKRNDMRNNGRIAKSVTVTIDGVAYQGTYSVQRSMVYVRSPLGTKATQVGESPPETIAWTCGQCLGRPGAKQAGAGRFSLIYENPYQFYLERDAPCGLGCLKFWCFPDQQGKKKGAKCALLEPAIFLIKKSKYSGANVRAGKRLLRNQQKLDTDLLQISNLSKYNR